MIISDYKKAFEKTSKDKQDIYLYLKLLRLYKTYKISFEYIIYKLDKIKD